MIQSMPSPEDTLSRAITGMGLSSLSQERARDDFVPILNDLLARVYEVLKAEQADVERRLVRMAAELVDSDPDRAAALTRAGQLSLGQQRKKRAGVDMERAMSWLLHRAGIPNENGQPITGRSDLVVPSVELFRVNPERCIILECKRTARERWKEVTDQVSAAGHNVWFVTFDDQLSQNTIDKLVQGGVVVYLLPEIFSRTKKNLKVRSIGNLVNDLKFFVKE